MANRNFKDVSIVDNRFRDARRHRDAKNAVAADMEVESPDSLSMDLLSAGTIQLQFVSRIGQLRIRDCKFEEIIAKDGFLSVGIGSLLVWTEALLQEMSGASAMEE